MVCSEAPRGQDARSVPACRRGHRLALALALAVLLSVVLAACGGDGDDGDTAIQRAEAKVAAKERALSDTQAELAAATTAFCDTSADYVIALDRYGDVLTSTTPTVGDVNEAGADLVAPQEDTLQAAEAAVAARDEVSAAEEELATAKAELKAVKNGQQPSPPSASSSPAPLAPAATVNRVKQAEAEFEAVRSGIDEDTPLTEASQQFNAAAVALEMSWLQLFADAGCLTEDQQKQAATAARDYTIAVQTALATAGHYDGEVDGVYGPQTVAAVEQLQADHQLPVTGTVDKATAAALQSDVLAAGGAAAQEELAATAALQQTLKLAGYWDGPVDGIWTPALTEAVKNLQTDLGVKPTGTVDAATVAAFEDAISEAGQSESPEATPSAPPSPEPTETGSPTTETPETSPSAS